MTPSELIDMCLKEVNDIYQAAGLDGTKYTEADIIKFINKAQYDLILHLKRKEILKRRFNDLAS